MTSRREMSTITYTFQERFQPKRWRPLSPVFSALFGSVEERREHYTIHCQTSSAPAASSNSRVRCKLPSCSLDFESEAEMTRHFLLIHKVKDPTFSQLSPKRNSSNRISCKVTTCVLDFETVAEMMTHFF